MSEPVAYINVQERKLEWATLMRWETPTVVKMDKVPLYTAPPRREWVGMTDEEMFDIYGQNHVGKLCNLGRLVEAKLKEKNGF